jgi:hypothetical protein
VVQTYSPRFEILEDRHLLSTVTNFDDHGPGSLRQAIVQAEGEPQSGQRAEHGQ